MFDLWAVCADVARHAHRSRLVLHVGISPFDSLHNSPWRRHYQLAFAMILRAVDTFWGKGCVCVGVDSRACIYIIRVWLLLLLTLHAPRDGLYPKQDTSWEAYRQHVAPLATWQTHMRPKLPPTLVCSLGSSMTVFQAIQWMFIKCFLVMLNLESWMYKLYWHWILLATKQVDVVALHSDWWTWWCRE